MANPFAGLRSYQRNLRYQGYQKIPVEQFGGLRLDVDPRELGFGGALDLLNVEFDKRGRLRSRDGYAVLGTKAAAAFDYLYSFMAPNGTFEVLAWNGNGGVQVFNGATGATIGSASGTTGTTDARSTLRSAVLAVTPSATKVYVAAGDQGLQAFDAAANTWSNITAATIGASWNRPYRVGFTPFDQRLVVAVYDSGVGSTQTVRLRFSDPGAFSTYGTNNYVDMVSGTTAQPSIEAIVTWRELLFVFLRDVFYVFYGTSTDSTGNPVFNYRTTAGFGGTTAAAGRAGVYFFDGRAVYVTTGGEPVKISQPIEPYLQGQTLPYFVGSPNWSAPPTSGRLTVGADERVYLQLANGATFVYDPITQTWAVWDMTVPAFGLVPAALCADLSPFAGAPSSVLFVVGDANVYKKSPASTTDGGSAISSRYRSGFQDISGGARADDRRIARQWRLRGTGTVNFGVAADMATTIPTTGGGAQGSVNLAGPYPNYRTSQQGNNLSWQVSSTSGAWRLDAVEADLT